MKTLIFNGSPRKAGDTVALINELVNNLMGEYKIVNTYDCGIKPCIDCRFCWDIAGCSQKDEMQEVYKYIQECDNILIASPIYFSELSGQLLSVASRLQTYFCARYFRGEIPPFKKKKGAVILVGGGDGDIQTAYKTACRLLHHMNSEEVLPLVYSFDTNNIPAKDDRNALEETRNIAGVFNSGCNRFDVKGECEIL